MHAYRKTSLTRKPPRRQGFALLLVLVFTMIFMLLVGVATRQVTSVLRVASIRAVQGRRDEGSIEALGRAMHLLETGLPPSSPYVCGATINTSGGPRSYTITFTQQADGTWTVRSDVQQPSETPTPMPDSFAPP